MDKIEIQKIDDYFLPDCDLYTRIKPLRNDILHRHEFIELFYILSGNSEHFVNNQKIHLQNGDALLLLPQDIHKHIKSGASKDFLYRDVLIRPSFFIEICNTYSDKLYSDFTQNIFSHKISFSGTDLFLFENIFMKLSSAVPNDIRPISNLLLHNFISAYANQNVLQKTKQQPNWLITLISELNRPSNFSIPLTELTAAFHYTKPYLCNEFKKHVGMTITEFFNKNRINYADSLLNTTNYTIKEICEMLGFNNISHFYSLYKKQFNRTPRFNDVS